MTGAGKTNLLETVTEQDIMRGVPIIFIDGKGDRSCWPNCFLRLKPRVACRTCV